MLRRKFVRTPRTISDSTRGAYPAGNRTRDGFDQRRVSAEIRDTDLDLTSFPGRVAGQDQLQTPELGKPFSID